MLNSPKSTLSGLTLAAPASQPQATAGSAPRGPAHGPPAKTILVVDDDLVIQKTVSAKLTRAGYRVLTATDGPAAITIVRVHRPDLILLDFNFPPDVSHGGVPSWDGLDILYWLRNLKGAEHTRFMLKKDDTSKGK